MEKPDTEKGSAEAVHPDAAAYYDNNEESFMDRYGDWHKWRICTGASPAWPRLAIDFAVLRFFGKDPIRH